MYNLRRHLIESSFEKLAVLWDSHESSYLLRSRSISLRSLTRARWIQTTSSQRDFCKTVFHSEVWVTTILKFKRNNPCPMESHTNRVQDVRLTYISCFTIPAQMTTFTSVYQFIRITDTRCGRCTKAYVTHKCFHIFVNPIKIIYDIL